MRHTPRYVAITILLVALVVAGCSSTSEPTTTVPDTTSTSTSTSTTTTQVPATTSTTSTTAPASTTTTTEPAVTTTVPPVADEREVAIIAAQADGVVRDFTGRLTQAGIGYPPALEASDPFDGPARYYLELWKEREAAYTAAYENGYGLDAWKDASVMDAFWEDSVWYKAGDGRITPVGGGLYYVDGIYNVESKPLYGAIGGFHFKVEGDQAILVNMVRWTDTATAGSLNEGATTSFIGVWLDELIVEDELTIRHADGDITVDISKAVLRSNPGWTYLLLTMDFNNTGSSTRLVWRETDLVPLGEITEYYNAYVERAGELVSGNGSYMPNAIVAPGSTAIGALNQTLPPEALSYATGTLEILDVSPDVDEDSVVGNFVDFDLSKLESCHVVNVTETELGVTDCSRPRDLYNQ